MSSKGKNAYGDYEMLRAAVTQKEHTENEYGVVVTTTIHVCRSPYVLRVRVAAWPKGQDFAEREICSYEVEWPNANVISWTAQLFQAYVKLDRLVEDSYTDWERAWSLKQS